MASKVGLHSRVARCASENGWSGPVVFGLDNSEISRFVRDGSDFLYWDHSYFRRGWDKENFRLTRRWVHLTEIKPRPDDRMKKFGVTIEPWRRRGEKVVVIPPTDFQRRLGCYHWTDKTVERLASITDRPVVVKKEKGRLMEFLEDAWAVVTWGSVAGVEAALMGVPVFAEPTCPAYPVSAGPLEQIETPEYSERRHEWACSLAYASWNINELGKMRFKDYDYSLRDNLS